MKHRALPTAAARGLPQATDRDNVLNLDHEPIARGWERRLELIQAVGLGPPSASSG